MSAGAGAPPYCADLAKSGLDVVPSLISKLVDPSTAADARGQLANVKERLAAINPTGEGSPKVKAALDGTVRSLDELIGAKSPDKKTLQRLAEGMTALGTEVQPVCRFPTVR